MINNKITKIILTNVDWVEGIIRYISITLVGSILYNIIRFIFLVFIIQGYKDFTLLINNDKYNSTVIKIHCPNFKNNDRNNNDYECNRYISDNVTRVR